MPTANPWKSYRQITTLTAPPGQIVLMLFEGALGALERALPGFADPAEANMTIHNNLQRAQEIIRQLNGALNMKQGGEFAGTMRRLYDYFERRLWESNLREKAGRRRGSHPPSHRAARRLGDHARRNPNPLPPLSESAPAYATD